MSLTLQAGRASDGRFKTGLVFLDQALVSGVNFLIGVLLARYLGPSGYGQFVLSYNIILFIGGIQGALVVSPMMVLGGARHGAQAREYFSAVLIYSLVVCVVFVLLMAAGLAVAIELAPQWQLQGIASPLALAAAAVLFQDFWRRYLFVQNRSARALLNDIVAYGARVGLLMTLALALGLSTRITLLIIAATCLMAFLASAGPLLNNWPKAPARAVLFSVAHEHWALGKWLVAEIMVYWCGSQLVLYVTAQLISAAAVGGVAAAQNIVAAVHVLMLALENLVPSRAANMYALHGIAGLRRYLRRVALLGSAIILGIVVVATLWAEFWLELAYGSAYQDDGWIVGWWGIFYLLGFLQRPFSIALRVLGRTKAIFLATSSSALVAMILSYPLIKFYGLTGTMLTLCLVQGAGLAVLALALRKRLSAEG